MPISPAYSWSETDTTVNVTAQCKGVTSASSDVFCSPHYVSINASPYFLELDLCGRIDAQKSVATVRRGEVVLKLMKFHPGTSWGRLLVDLPRPERLQRREESRATAQAEVEATLERKKKKVWEDSRWTLGKQMDLDREERARIEQLKEEEHAAEAAKLQAFEEEVGRVEQQRRHGAGGSGGGGGKQMGSREPLTAAVKVAGSPLIEEVPPLLEGAAAEQDIFGDDDVAEGDAPPAEGAANGDSAAADGAAADGAGTSSSKDEPAAPAPASLPPPRSTAKVTIKFTKQLLTAPARSVEFDSNRSAPRPNALYAWPDCVACPLPTGPRDPTLIRTCRWTRSQLRDSERRPSGRGTSRSEIPRG